MNGKYFSAYDVVITVLMVSVLISVSGYNGVFAQDAPKEGGHGEAASAPEPKPELSPVGQMLIGDWTYYRNKQYGFTGISDNGKWTSAIRIESPTSQDIEREIKASGTWKTEGKQLILTVTESDAEDIWAKGKDYIFNILELNEKDITLKYPDLTVLQWNKLTSDTEEKPEEKKEQGKEEVKQEEDGKEGKEGKTENKAAKLIKPVIPMKPIVVNLNKISSSDKNRYLCIALLLRFKEMKSDNPVLRLHPRVWDATILFLSSLLYNDVKTFDAMKIVTEKLGKILNPYFNGLLEEVVATNIMVSSSMEKVEEFIIAHSKPPALETPEGEKKEGGKEGEKQSHGSGGEQEKEKAKH